MADVTQLPVSASSEDRASRERLLARVYNDLRQLAAAKMTRGSLGHKLQPTAPVREIFPGDVAQ